MRISTKGIYALEVVVDLAIHSSGESFESLKNIANRRNLSEKYLERIMKGLKENGVLNGARGARGGYCLAKDMSQITALEVLNAVEGQMAPVTCLIRETECGIELDACPTREAWKQIWEGIKEVTGKVTVRDRVEEVENVSIER